MAFVNVSANTVLSHYNAFLTGSASTCLTTGDYPVVQPQRRAASVTMQQQQQETLEIADTPTETPTAVWPPPEMSEEWAEAVERLAAGVPGTTLEAADIALDQADGDESAALLLLMDENWSDIRRQREETVARARAAGDVNRVSAVKEAELRRRATGSARDFFKGYVEITGAYVDSGYVDESADTMGKIGSAFNKWFGGKKSS